MEGEIRPDSKHHACRPLGCRGRVGFGVRQASAAGGVDYHVQVLINAGVVDDELGFGRIDRLGVASACEREINQSYSTAIGLEFLTLIFVD